MNIQIKNSSDDPIYLQIKDQIKFAILSGELKGGDSLPSIRMLAKELRVSVITTKRAYDELENDGFIHSVQGKGSFVAPLNQELVKDKLLKKIEDHFRAILTEAKVIGLSREELLRVLEFVEKQDE